MALSADIIKRIKGCRSLPTMPGVAIRLVEICGSENAGVRDVAALLQQDPALSSKVLRYANSAVFGSGSSVTSIQRAAVLLGLLTLQTTAMSFSLVNTMQKVSLGGFDHKQYWRRSLFCAAGAQALAEQLGTPAPDSLFMVGLLDDIGMLILAHAMGAEYTAVLAGAGRSHQEIAMAERKALGFDHSAVTAWIEREWRLPAPFVAAAEAGHRSLESAVLGVRASGSMASIVALAAIIADAFGPQDGRRPPPGYLQSIAQRVHALNGEDVSAVLDRTLRLVSTGAALLDIDAGSPDENANMLEQARESLFVASARSTREIAVIRTESQRDPLTGLWNRGYLDHVVEERYAEAARSGPPLGVAFIDIDHFKAVNDTYGHATGDVVLKAVARRLQDMVRSTDVVARYGGEEFVILFSNMSAAAARLLCPQICERIAKVPVDLGDGRTLTVMVSLGFTTTEASMAGTGMELLGIADLALYASKRGGRNRATEG
ncbi:MAG: GGDEF domain-containing protein [Deltaproteobacteria bacterium]